MLLLKACRQAMTSGVQSWDSFSTTPLFIFFIALIIVQCGVSAFQVVNNIMDRVAGPGNLSHHLWNRDVLMEIGFYNYQFIHGNMSVGHAWPPLWFLLSENHFECIMCNPFYVSSFILQSALHKNLIKPWFFQAQLGVISFMSHIVKVSISLGYSVIIFFPLEVSITVSEWRKPPTPGI